MGTILLLGPSEWLEKGGDPTPMDHRRALAGVFREHGHAVLLMEDEADEVDEDMVAKFDRLLAKTSDVVLFWPPQAKMSTTYTEMVLLRKADDAGRLPRLWFLHHESVASIERGAFKVHEPGARSRYLMSLARLGITPVPWRTQDDLRERAALLAAEIG